MFEPQSYGYPPSGGGGQSSFYHSIKGLSFICALIATVFCGPLLGNWSEVWMIEYITENYGYSAVEYGIWIWKALCFAFVFFLARAFAVAALALISLALVQRMPFLAAV